MNYILIDKKAIPEPDIHKWAMWYNENDRRVKLTVLSESVEVSTVFLGMDATIFTVTTPMVFETMVFGGEHDQYCRRYATYEEAEQGHEETLKMIMGIDYI